MSNVTFSSRHATSEMTNRGATLPRRRLLLVVALGALAVAFGRPSGDPGTVEVTSLAASEQTPAALETATTTTPPTTQPDALDATAPAEPVVLTTTTVAEHTHEPATTVPPPVAPAPAPEPAPTTTEPPAPPPEPESAPAGDPESIIRSVFGDAHGDDAVAIARCESDLNPRAHNPAGYHGLFQIGDGHAGRFESVTGRSWSDRYDAHANTVYAKYLFDGSGWTQWGCRSVVS